MAPTTPNLRVQVKHGIKTFDWEERNRLKQPSSLDYFDVEVDFVIRALNGLRFLTRLRVYKLGSTESVNVIIPPTLWIRLRQHDAALIESDTRTLRDFNAASCYFLTDLCKKE
jgi:hypothetical protein